jgi:hypothetical protein
MHEGPRRLREALFGERCPFVVACSAWIKAERSLVLETVAHGIQGCGLPEMQGRPVPVLFVDKLGTCAVDVLGQQLFGGRQQRSRRQSQGANGAMKHCVGAPNRGMFLKPNDLWDGNPDHEFVILERLDLDQAKDVERHRSASRMQGHVTLSVTEAELAAAT